jgi:hypothetical protein
MSIEDTHQPILTPSASCALGGHFRVVCDRVRGPTALPLAQGVSVPPLPVLGRRATDSDCLPNVLIASPLVDLSNGLGPANETVTETAKDRVPMGI